MEREREHKGKELDPAASKSDELLFGELDLVRW